MGRSKLENKVSIDRHLFRAMAEKARITEKAADIMFDGFLKYMIDAYMNDQPIEISRIGVITPIPLEEKLGWNIAKLRTDYIVTNRNPKIRLYTTLKTKKRCQFKQNQEQK